MQRQQTVLTPNHFTQLYFEKLKALNVSKQIIIAGNLHIVCDIGNNKKLDVRLDNIYNNYKLDPSALEHLLKRHLSSIIEGLQGSDLPDSNRIIPLIRSPSYLSNAGDVVFKKLNSEIVIVYAEDLPNGFRILLNKDIERLGMNSSKLLQLSINNLGNIITTLEFHTLTEGCYGVTAGGDHESSFILDQVIWKNHKFPIHGDPVFAVPAKDMFLFTGSNNAEGIQKLQEIVEKIFNNGGLLISRKLFIMKGTKLEIFNP